MKYFLEQTGNSMRVIATLQFMLAKMMRLSMPSICMINGHAYAGALIFALCHDFRIMREKSGKLCLSEINIGVTLPPAYADIVKQLIPKQLLREMIMGRACQIPEALKHNLI